MYFSLLLDTNNEQLKEIKYEKETVRTTTKSTITLKLTSSSKSKSTETKTATTKKPKSTKVANSQFVFSS